MPKFIGQGDAQRMLSHSIVSYEGRLIYVLQVVGNMMVASDVETGELLDLPADFDIIKNPTDGRLGYVNGLSGCSLFERTAARITTMGLCGSNVRVKAAHHGPRLRSFTQFTTLAFKPMVETYHNRFPSFKEAFSRAMESEKPTAFDRSFAIDWQGTLMFRGRPAGKARSDKMEDVALNDLGKGVWGMLQVPKLKWKN